MTRVERGLVSIIIPVFNRPDFLRAAVDQVLAQTYEKIEVILVDDGSTDGTGSVCVEIARQHPDCVRTVHRENGGPGAARETGRLLARGEFLQYFDSDDEIAPRKIEVQVAALRARPDCGIAYCRTHEFSRGEEAGNQCSQFTGERLEFLFPRLLAGCCWPTVTPLIRRDVSDQAGAWLTIRQEEDWEYDARFGAMGVRLVYCDEFLASAVNHPGARASDGGRSPAKLRDRFVAQSTILEHALSARVSLEDPNMRHFARSLFLLSRQCGAAGLTLESERLLTASMRASGGGGIDQRLYRALAGVVGWRMAGTLACGADRWRRSR